MKALNPQDIPDLFRQAFGLREIDSVVSLYEKDAVIATDSKLTIRGHAAIRAMVTGFMTKSPQFTLHESEAVQVGDVALVRSRWTVRMTESDGKEKEVNVEPTLVARQQSEGGWLVVIDRPLAGRRASTAGE